MTTSPWHNHQTSVTMRCTTKHISLHAKIKGRGEIPAEILHISGDFSFRRDESETQFLQHLSVTMSEASRYGTCKSYVPFLEHTIYTRKDSEDEWRVSLTRGVLKELGFLSLVKWRNLISIDIRETELLKQKPMYTLIKISWSWIHLGWKSEKGL